MVVAKKTSAQITHLYFPMAAGNLILEKFRVNGYPLWLTE
jgi:hypothetical protein